MCRLHTWFKNMYIYFFSSYSKSCPSVLLKVYESLMLPIPLDLSNNPGSHDKSPITQQSQEQSATGSESGSMHSLQELSATSRRFDKPFQVFF